MSKKTDVVAKAVERLRDIVSSTTRPGWQFVKVGKQPFLVPDYIPGLVQGLLKGERSTYYRLLVQLAKAHNPANAAEWILIGNLTMVSIQLARFARAEAGIFVKDNAVEPPRRLIAGNFTPRDMNSEVKAAPTPRVEVSQPKPREKKMSRYEMGRSLLEHIEVFERAQGILGELARRRRKIMKELHELQAQRRAMRPHLVDAGSHEAKK